MNAEYISQEAAESRSCGPRCASQARSPAGAGLALGVDAAVKVAFVTTSVSRRAGGLLYAMRPLTQSLKATGEVAINVLGVEDAHTRQDFPEWCEPPQVFRRSGPAAFGYAPGMAGALAESGSDLAHTHGLWVYPSLAVRRWSQASGRPYLVSPHGMLDPWAVRHSGWKKRLAGWAYEHNHLKGAACLHALCVAEAEAIRGYGLYNPVCVIPNGVDLPGSAPDRAPAWESSIPSDARVLLYIGRLHSKKGLPVLLDGWRLARGAAKSGAWHLVIAGWDQGGHQAELVEQVERAGLLDQVHFVGPQFGAEKTVSFYRADAFVLPSFSEGLPMTVLEAWAHGRAVLMTRACNLPEGFEACAALEMGTNPDAIASALQELFAMPDAERLAMGERGRRLVANRFAWIRVAGQMLAVYRWILGQDSKPSCVMFD